MHHRFFCGISIISDEDISIAEYVQRVKVEYAKKQLESGNKNINEIIYEVGYNDVDAFRKIFKKHTDLSLVDYRKKYRV